MAVIQTLGDSMTLARKAVRIFALGAFVRAFTHLRQVKAYKCVVSETATSVISRNKMWQTRMGGGMDHNHPTCLYRIDNARLLASSCNAVDQAPWSRTLWNSWSQDNTCVQNKLQAKSLKHCFWHYPVRYYSSSKETVEKRLLYLMDMWEVEDAVALLRQSVEDNVIPHANVVLNLQQQLANLGEVECLLELHDFLKEHNLTSDSKFFHCLQEAYYNSGRISEGVAVLRLLYHRTRVFADVEVYFTLLTVMVMQHFPDRLDLILQFVTDLKDAEIPVLDPEASLWKCYMMMGKWADADDLLLSNEELRPLLPRQIARICQGVDRVQLDHVAVLTQLLNLPFIRQKLRVSVAETLIAHLVKEKQWQRLLKTLKKLKTAGLPLHADKLSPIFDDLQRHLAPQYDDQIQELRLWCDSLRGDTKQ